MNVVHGEPPMNAQTVRSFKALCSLSVVLMRLPSMESVFENIWLSNPWPVFLFFLCHLLWIQSPTFWTRGVVWGQVAFNDTSAFPAHLAPSSSSSLKPTLENLNFSSTSLVQCLTDSQNTGLAWSDYPYLRLLAKYGHLVVYQVYGGIKKNNVHLEIDDQRVTGEWEAEYIIWKWASGR